MAIENLHHLLKSTVEKLKGLIPQFDRGGDSHNEKVYGALHQLRMPGLPESVRELTIDYTQAPESGNAFAAVRAGVDQLEAVADALDNDGKEQLADTLRTEIAELDAALEGCQASNPRK